MMHLMPYDENVLHKLAYTRFFQGDAEWCKGVLSEALAHRSA